MTTPAPDTPPQSNPYAPPEASLGEAPAGSAGSDPAVALRRQFIKRETLVKLLGSLHLVVAGFGCLILGMLVVAEVAITPPRGASVVSAVLVSLLVVTGLNLALGLGLLGLRAWARWTDVVILALGLIVNAAELVSSVRAYTLISEVLVGAVLTLVLPGTFLLLLVLPGTSVVFSREYHEVIARTPHVRMRGGCLLKAVVIGAVVLFLLSMAGFMLFGTMTRVRIMPP